MKKGIIVERYMSLLLLLLVPLLSGCEIGYHPPVTPTDADLKPLEFSEVVTADGFTKDQLYSAALAWYGSAYRSAKAVFDVQDREAGRIVGKPLFKYEPSRFMGSAVIRGVVTYSVTIEVKDGRYRYIIGNFVHEGSRSVSLGIVVSPASLGLLTNAEYCPYPKADIDTGLVNDTWRELKMRATDEAALLIANLKKNMVQPTHKTDW